MRDYNIITPYSAVQKRVIELLEQQKDYKKDSEGYWIIEGKIAVYKAMLNTK